MKVNDRRLRLAFIVIICLTGIILVNLWYKSTNSPSKSPLIASQTNQRILVIAPHPDDESLGTGGLISEAAARGAKVKVVFITNGDGSHYGVKKLTGHAVVKPNDYILYGQKRQQEAIQAVNKLGIKKEDIIFLGFPDQGIVRIWRSYWDASLPYTSNQTHKSSVPYQLAASTGELYTAPALINSLLNICQEYIPTDIYVTGTYDCHPDHWASGAFTFFSESILEQKDLSFRPRVYTFDIHRADWQMANKDKTLLPPVYFLDYGDKWYISSLSNQTLQSKRQALSEYKSQIMIMPVFFKSMEGKTQEIFHLHKRKYISRVDQPFSPTSGKNWPTDALTAFNSIKTQKNSPNSILKAVYLLQDEQNIRFCLTTQGKKSNKNTYLINLCLLPTNTTAVKRYSVKITPQTRQYKWVTKPEGSYPIEMEYTKNRIDIKISNLLSDHKYLMLNIDSVLNGKIVDRVPWERLILKE